MEDDPHSQHAHPINQTPRRYDYMRFSRIWLVILRNFVHRRWTEAPHLKRVPYFEPLMVSCETSTIDRDLESLLDIRIPDPSRGRARLACDSRFIEKAQRCFSFTPTNWRQDGSTDGSTDGQQWVRCGQSELQARNITSWRLETSARIRTIIYNAHSSRVRIVPYGKQNSCGIPRTWWTKVARTS